MEREAILCPVCRDPIARGDPIIIAVEQVEAGRFGDDQKRYMDGQAGTFHERHWSQRSGLWREVRRGVAEG